MVRTPMSDTLRGLSMPNRAFDTRSRREEQQREQEQTDEDAGGPESTARLTTSTPPSTRSGAAGRPPRGGDDRRCRAGATAVRATAAIVVARDRRRGATVVVGAIIVVDSITSTSRPATRANAAETPAASSAEVTGPSALRLVEVGLGGGQADGLDVQALGRTRSPPPASPGCPRPCRPTARRAPCASPTA